MHFLFEIEKSNAITEIIRLWALCIQFNWLTCFGSFHRPDASELLKLPFFKKARVSSHDVHALGLLALHFSLTQMI